MMTKKLQLCMAFDTTGRKLITGGRDGSIKLWNFNNGACLCVFDTNYTSEVKPNSIFLNFHFML